MARADIHKVKGDESFELSSSGHFHKDDVIVIEVVLSERNLLSLLSKLHIDGSKRTLYNSDVPDGHILKLVAENDETHYASSSRNGFPPGLMAHPTEVLVAALKKTLETYERDTKIVNLFNKGAEEAKGA